MKTRQPGKEQHDHTRFYQPKITLLGTTPPIWRRILVPAALSLAKLHNVLQISMGWNDEHMHVFRAGQRRIGRPEPADPFNANGIDGVDGQLACPPEDCGGVLGYYDLLDAIDLICSSSPRKVSVVRRPLFDVVTLRLWFTGSLYG